MTASAFVLLLVDAAGEVADVLAFLPDGATALWLSRVAMAGEDEVLAPRLDDPLNVHAGVMKRLRAGRRGVAILDHARAAASLYGLTLRTTTAEHALLLRVALARPAPRVVVAAIAAQARVA